jgi:transposase-like protein
MSDVSVGLVRRRPRLSREEGEQLVREYEASGLTRQAFCQGRGLSVATLDKHRRQYGRGAARREGRLVAVEVMPAISASNSNRFLWVELANGRRISVEDGFDTATLERLLAVLERA